MNSTNENLNKTQLQHLSKKIKPIIGFRAKLRCGTELHMICLSRELPKTLASIDISIGIESQTGNKGMKQLCKALKNSKSAKRFLVDIGSCHNNQIRILAQWLKTCKYLNKLMLGFNWNNKQTDQGLTELLSYVKSIKDLNELEFKIKREYTTEQQLNVKPSLELRCLKRLQKLKISRKENDSGQGNYIRELLKSMRNLKGLTNLDFDFLFYKGQLQKELEESFLKCLREMANLKHLKINLSPINHFFGLRQDNDISEETLDELFSSICDLNNLASLHLISGIGSPRMLKYIKRLRESLEKNPSFKSLNLEAKSGSPTDLLIEGLSLGPNDSLKSLKVDFSQSTFDTPDLFLQQMEMRKLCKSLTKSLSLQSLFIFFPYQSLSSEALKDFGQSLPTLSKSLSNLKLSLSCDSDLNTEKISYMTAGIKALDVLTSLNLDLKANNILSEGMRLIAESIDTLENLQELTLDLSMPRRPSHRNTFVSFFKRKDKMMTGLGYFGPVFQRHKKLIYLELILDDLQPSPEEFEALTFGIEGLKALRSFKLSSNDKRMKNEMLLSFRSLYTSLKTLPVLKCLVLKYGLVNAEDLESLLLHVGGLINLVELELWFGNLESLRYETAEYFTEAIKKLRLLRMLSFSIGWRGDGIEAEIVHKFHEGLRNMEYLEGFVWGFIRVKDQEQTRRNLEAVKYMRVFSSFVRYRCFHQFALLPL